jgi:hypothetical protein
VENAGFLSSEWLSTCGFDSSDPRVGGRFADALERDIDDLVRV